MRLTLRTLLAWMDDTLSASEVREIGKQMSESPYARELAEKINKVARLRRLTVPSETGPDACDPNMVAAYLDNELGAEDVTAIEKLCLTSDVNLAEVASVHQILSLIGQKAKVPPEARHRMYRLVKGREAIASRAAKAFAPSHDEIKAQPAPVPPAPKWSAAQVPKKSLSERFGLAAAVVGLMGVLVFAAMQSLQEGSTTTAPRVTEPLAQAGEPVLKGRPRGGMMKGEGPVAAPVGEAVAVQPVEKEATKVEPQDTPKKEQPAVENLGIVVDKFEGVALSAASAGAAWKPLEPNTELKVGSRVVNLTPSWVTLKAGPHVVTMSGVGELTVEAGGTGRGNRLVLEQGRLLIKNITREASFDISYRGKVMTLSALGSTVVGLEVQPQTLAGTADVPAPSLQINVPDGELNLHWGMTTTRLNGPSGVSLLPSDQFSDHSRGEVPGWVTASGPSAFDSQVSGQLAKAIRPNRPILTSLVEGRDDSDKEVRRLSINALAALGDAGDLVTALNEPIEPATRKEAAAAVRYLLARSPESRKAVRAELERTFGMAAEATEKLLAGFSGAETKEDASAIKLVQLLSAPDLGTRALAIDALMKLTGRDAMEYDPTMPEGRGLSAWKELVTKKELKKGIGERTPPPPQPK